MPRPCIKQSLFLLHCPGSQLGCWIHSQQTSLHAGLVQDRCANTVHTGPCSSCAALQGIEPWNKGRAMRPETCQKMSAAKQGCTIPRAVRAKISQSRTGQLHSEVLPASFPQHTAQPESPCTLAKQLLHSPCASAAQLLNRFCQVIA